MLRDYKDARMMQKYVRLRAPTSFTRGFPRLPEHVKDGWLKSTSSCCLCSSKLDESKGKGKHKKFNGPGSVIEREVLRDCVLELDVHDAVNNVFEGDVTICYSCCLKLRKIKKYDEDLKKFKLEIHNFLCVHCENTTDNTQQQEPSVGRRNLSLSKAEIDSSPPAKVSKTAASSSACASPACEVSKTTL